MGGVRNRLDRLLAEAAAARGLSADELDDRLAPDHGLIPGPLILPAGPGQAIVTARPTGLALSWRDAAGVVHAAPPKTLRAAAPEAVRTAQARVKAISAELTRQKHRLQDALRRGRTWDHAAWRCACADHGTLGALARRLVWQAETGAGPRSVLPVAAGAEDATGAPVDLRGARITLWHPLEATEDERQAWRTRLAGLGIVQPFRQVWRETYALTPAERATVTYSNRFAGHVLRQLQLRALADAQGWTARHLVAFDAAEEAPLHLQMPAFGVQAEFLIRPAGVDCPVSDGGTYRFIVTDRIRFHRLDPGARFGRGVAMPLTDVPPRAFSEVLRDADLFTSVASIGLDPGWQDAGPEAPPPGAWRQAADAYWNWTQGAELSASAETRRALLAILLPGMELGRVAALDGRHLVVTGQRSRYRIHLGSAAVHDLGRDRHLCIQPDRTASAPMLRLEGDEILSIILSKALLLARDDRITDPSILRQMD
ncbi:DUF4132 domain-containing protein [Tabrizicola sp.]|uniref:DUF4132 domain-containing protein n=1 Tax=Tabrizicola sp. TaxID=2005166 RepID=UPI003D26D958